MENGQFKKLGKCYQTIKLFHDKRLQQNISATFNFHFSSSTIIDIDHFNVNPKHTKFCIYSLLTHRLIFNSALL